MDETGSKSPAGGGRECWGSMLLRGVKLLRLRTAHHTIKFSPQNSVGEFYTWQLVRRKALRELLSQLLSSRT